MSTFAENMDWAARFSAHFKKRGLPVVADRFDHFLTDYRIWERTIASVEIVEQAPGSVTVVYPGRVDLVTKAQNLFGWYMDTVEGVLRKVARTLSPTRQATKGFEAFSSGIDKITEDAVEKLERIAAIPARELGDLIGQVANAQENVIKSAAEFVKELGTAGKKVGWAAAAVAAVIAIIIIARGL